MELTPTEVEAVTQDVIEKYQKFVNPTQVALLKVGGFDHIEHKAEGVTITDLEGNTYIDCLGGYGVFSLGHRHPKVVDAVKRQLDLIPMGSKTFLNKPLADLCAKLAEITPGDLQYSFISNSGAEAAEAALKIARMATGKTDFISTIGAYHGKTMGALAITGREVYRKPFEPMLPGGCFVPFDDAPAIEAAITDKTAAVILEPVQGEGGIIVPSPDYFPRVREICDRHGILLIADEVQTGLGRTGKLFAVDHWNVKPDMMTLAKSLGGGVMPIGATLATAEIWGKVFHENPFIHTSTFGGGELACAAALAALEVIEEEDLATKAAENGAYFLTGLQSIAKKYPKILSEARGLGLMLGAEFTDSDIGKLVIGTMVHRGVVAAYTLNNPKVVRFEPPLIITRAEIDTVLGVFEAGIQDAIALLGDLI